MQQLLSLLECATVRYLVQFWYEYIHCTQDLRFSRQRCCRLQSAAVWLIVIRWVVPGNLKDHHAFVFKGHVVHTDNLTGKDESKVLFQNNRNYLQSDEAAPPRTCESSITMLVKLQNSYRKG